MNYRAFQSQTTTAGFVSKLLDNTVFISVVTCYVFHSLLRNNSLHSHSHSHSYSLKTKSEREHRVSEWHTNGGVIIINYDTFKILVDDRDSSPCIQSALIDPGPDLVICDEGHLLKNDKTTLSGSLNAIKTMRRVALTGTPLQNNLEEYYCMVQFVKPHLLGTLKEFRNRFINPITNGQYQNSFPGDIQMMKARSYILHKLLDGCVQRLDISVLAKMLPPKHEYVLYIQLTPLQIDLYKVCYMIYDLSFCMYSNKFNENFITVLHQVL